MKKKCKCFCFGSVVGLSILLGGKKKVFSTVCLFNCMAQNVPDCTDCKQIFKIFLGNEEYFEKNCRCFCFGSVVGLSNMFGKKRAKNEVFSAVKIWPRMRQIAQILTKFSKFSRGGMPPDPPSLLACFAGSTSWLRHFTSGSSNKIGNPPLSKP